MKEDDMSGIPGQMAEGLWYNERGSYEMKGMVGWETG